MAYTPRIWESDSQSRVFTEIQLQWNVEVILDDHMTFSFCIDSRYTSGRKALSSIIGKYNVYGNFTYDMYSELYDACVIPTMMYGAEVFGYINPSNFEKIQKIDFLWGPHLYSNPRHDGRYGVDWYILIK